MTDSNTLTFYDISSRLAPRSYAPNPSKARLALSFKGVPFKTEFVEILDIPSVRQGLKCPAVRKLDDGSDFYTLPMLRSADGSHVIGDSFDIAVYLEDNFPTSGDSLFPADSSMFWRTYESPSRDMPFYAPLTTDRGVKHEDYARFNVDVDATFTAHMGFVGYYLPFNPETAEATRALFAKRAHLPSWDVLYVEGEAKAKQIEAMKNGLQSLAELFLVNKDGPFLEGKRATYADLIVGGWVNMFAMVMPEEDWKKVREWHQGVFGKLFDALMEKYYVCT